MELPVIGGRLYNYQWVRGIKFEIIEDSKKGQLLVPVGGKEELYSPFEDHVWQDFIMLGQKLYEKPHNLKPIVEFYNNWGMLNLVSLYKNIGYKYDYHITIELHAKKGDYFLDYVPAVRMEAIKFFIITQIIQVLQKISEKVISGLDNESEFDKLQEYFKFILNHPTYFLKIPKKVTNDINFQDFIEKFINLAKLNKTKKDEIITINVLMNFVTVLSYQYLYACSLLLVPNKCPDNFYYSETPSGRLKWFHPQFEIQIGATNLLSIIYLSYFQDLQANKIRICKECGLPLYSKNGRREYHTRCGNRKRAREFKQRNKGD
ncbi:CGNR zinc finger domain-containing protein [Caldanaerobacter subterraneus]|uniref:Uncharacterized protein n=1 Tax=Caldanaerobacter subterraneus subsp. pacificus DSM 12653 TaxID=391606 RepID=B7R6R6_9THEO|nr:CGNR zinc finger domain-containing protein [Caldanaerobacter subterraneus]KKC30911.1 hypothetical protein CDSM653_00008 [Caldanaerobacter subterraneus subsp. pacificus DSM 12653]